MKVTQHQRIHRLERAAKSQRGTHQAHRHLSQKMPLLLPSTHPHRINSPCISTQHLPWEHLHWASQATVHLLTPITTLQTLITTHRRNYKEDTSSSSYLIVVQAQQVRLWMKS